MLSRLGTALWCLLAPAAAHAAGTEPVDVTQLTTLDQFEGFEGHAFHAGHLWVGRSRKDLAAYYRLEVYDAAGKPVVTKELTHSLRYIYPYGNDSVLVVGIGLDQLSHYTVATLHGSDVTLEAHTIPIDALADRWLGRPGAMIFSDPGGFDDPDHPTPIGKPLQTLFTYDSTHGGPSWLTPHVAGPGKGVWLGGRLYYLSSPTIATGGRMLHRLGADGRSDEVLLDGRNRLVDVIALPEQGLLALAEEGAKQVLLYDTTAGHVTTLAIDAGQPRALAQVGHCLLVGTEDTKQVLFYNLEAPQPSVALAQWDLASGGTAFQGLRDLAADPVSGRVFARSAYACNPAAPCKASPNGVVMAAAHADSPALQVCLGQ